MHSFHEIISSLTVYLLTTAFYYGPFVTQKLQLKQVHIIGRSSSAPVLMKLIISGHAAQLREVITPGLKLNTSELLFHTAVSVWEKKSLALPQTLPQEMEKININLCAVFK